MNLWILNKNKDYLHQFNGLRVVHYDKNCWVILDFDTGYWYGEYTSRERTMEIVKEIQNFLNDIADNKIVGCVYEMPKE